MVALKKILQSSAILFLGPQQKLTWLLINNTIIIINDKMSVFYTIALLLLDICLMEPGRVLMNTNVTEAKEGRATCSLSAALLRPLPLQ